MLKDWNRKLNILGNEYTLNQVNLEIENECLLPRWLLFRQVRWKSGPGDLILEMMVPGGVGPMISPQHVAQIMAEAYTETQKMTLVELGWYEHDSEPFIHDVIVYDGRGGSINSGQRRIAEVRAEKIRLGLEVEA